MKGNQGGGAGWWLVVVSLMDGPQVEYIVAITLLLSSQCPNQMFGCAPCSQ